MLDATKLPIVREGTRLRPLSELDADAYASGTKDEAVLRFGHLPEPDYTCLLYTSPSPRDRQKSRMPSSA